MGLTHLFLPLSSICWCLRSTISAFAAEFLVNQSNWLYEIESDHHQLRFDLDSGLVAESSTFIHSSGTCMFIRLDLQLQFRGFSFTHIVMIWIELGRKLDPVLCFICAHHGHGRDLADVAVEHGVPQLARCRQREQFRKRPAEQLLLGLPAHPVVGGLQAAEGPPVPPSPAPGSRPVARLTGCSGTPSGFGAHDCCANCST